MYLTDLDKLSNTAAGKYALAKEDPKKYMVRAIAAGFFLVVAIIFSNVTAGLFYQSSHELAKLLYGVTFPLAIILVVFIGGELFTSNNMYMAVGAYRKKVTWKQAVQVWLFSYAGNLIGSLIFAGIFLASGASKAPVTEYMNATVLGKLEAPALQLFLKGVLCNFMVCLSVLAAARMKSEGGKLIVMFFIIMAFVIGGFEHSIANMGTFTIGYVLLGGLPAGLLVKSMICVTLGNIVGGAVLLAWPIQYMSTKE